MNFWRKIENYLIYTKLLKKNKDSIKSMHNIDIDWIGRMYTVLTIPEEQVKEAKKYDYNIIDNVLTKKIRAIESTLVNVGFKELILIENITPLDDNRNWGVVLTYRWLSLKNIFYFKLFSVLLIGLILTIILI